MQNRPFFFQRRLGYRRNPFGALTDEEWVAIAILPDAVTKLLTANFTHLQLLGSMGCGKTTSLLKLTEHFSRMGQRAAYEYLAQGERVFKTDTADLNVLLLDEAQRLNRRSRRRLLASAAQRNNDGLRLVLSSHRDLSPRFARLGLPLETINLETTLTPDYYAQTIMRRLDYFALPGADRAILSPDAVRFLYDAFYPNFRKAEYFLYEVWQKETAVREITAVDLRDQYSSLPGSNKNVSSCFGSFAQGKST